MKANIILFIAMACNEANRVWCLANGDESQKHWDEAEEWQRESAIKGVEFRLENPNAAESAKHDAWMADKVKEGWVYGEVKDPTAKTHPCIVPFNKLPEFQQKKDKLFCAIVDALAPAAATNAELSEGEYRVRTKFNPSATGAVDQIKQTGAKLINLINDMKVDRELTTRDQQSLGRLKSLSMTGVEHGVSDAVKAATVGL